MEATGFVQVAFLLPGMPKRYGLTVIMLGRPGSGKGTQAFMLAYKLSARAFGTGELLRGLAREKSFLGKKVDGLLAKGNLVPSWLASFVWIRELGKVQPHEPLIFDGSPRTLGEAKMLDEVLLWYGRNKRAVFLIDISPRESLRRLKNRRICVGCKRPLFLRKGLDVARQCVNCGGRLIRRSDDTPLIIRKRLKIFEKDLTPVIKYYRSQNTLRVIDGQKDQGSVSQEIFNIAKRWNKKS